MKKYTVISLFSGCGGTDLGFEGGFNFMDRFYSENPFQVIWANDIDKAACRTYQENFKKEIVNADIRDILRNDELTFNANANIPKKADLVIGGFPCQDFSFAGKRKGFKSERGNLYQSMVKVIKKVKPSVFLAENVKGLLTIDNGKAIEKIYSDFLSIGYDVEYKLFHLADYGIPQNRERVIIVGTKKKNNLKFSFPKKTHSKDNWVTLGDCISDLENIKEGEYVNHYWSKARMFYGTQGNKLTSKDKIAPTMRAEHHGNIEFHWNGTRRLSAREAARIQSFPDDFIFLPSTSSAYRQVGNAVPPVFAWHLAQSVQNYLNKLE